MKIPVRILSGFAVVVVTCAGMLYALHAIAMTPPYTPEGAQFTDNTPEAYRQAMHVDGLKLVVPTVVELPLLTTGERQSYLVVDDVSGVALPWYLKEVYTTTPAYLSIAVAIDGIPERSDVLIDKKTDSGLAFYLTDYDRGSAEITLNSRVPIESSSVVFDFGRNVLLATTIEIRAVIDGQERIILSKAPLMRESVSFIPTVSDTWIIDLNYAQPLVINELTLVQDNAERSVVRGLRFLAQPGSSYTVYHDPDRSVGMPYQQQGNLSSDEGVVILNPSVTSINQAFVASDSDQDQILDVQDNCVNEQNADQLDINRNGRGDVCDDFDRDGRFNSKDNCVNLPNSGQEDTDGDGMGDVCDAEESRVTERLPWVPWVGMGIAGVILVGLFAVVAMRPLKPREGSSDSV